MTQPDFEKLGVFYLGRPYDAQSRTAQDGFVLYDSKDLVTHAVCVGMTGSGKTGLCIGLLEEAAIDGIPAIVIDPKGDLANLLLAFPNLSPAEFLPWVNPQDAQQSGLSLEAFAAREAEKWKSGLARDGQDASRVRRLVDSAEFRVFSPGSQAGLPVSISGLPVGARAVVETSGGRSIAREAGPTPSYLGQSDRSVDVGLGAERAGSFTVRHRGRADLTRTDEAFLARDRLRVRRLGSKLEVVSSEQPLKVVELVSYASGPHPD